MFFKFLLKHGPGSPGQTAKTIIKQYYELKRKGNYDTEDIFYLIIKSRIMVSSFETQRNYSFALNIISDEFIDKEISLLIFLCLYVESKNVREGSRDYSIFNSITEVIYNVSIEHREICKLPLVEFREKAQVMVNILFSLR